MLLVTPAYATPLAAGPSPSSAGQTLRWTPVPGATRYRVHEVTAAGVERNFYVGERLTFTPRIVLENATFRVKARPLHASHWESSTPWASRCSYVKTSAGAGVCSGAEVMVV